MRALSARQAGTCETAKTKVCRCRCGGALHGIFRSKEVDAQFLAALPKDDPHHVDNAEQKLERKRQAKKEQKDKAQEDRWKDGLFGGL